MSENTPVSGNFETIPVYIVTGFLGSGKTTLLNHWVNTEEFKDTLVLINEFGDVGLDHELVQAVDDTVVLLGSGCICCTLQGELIDSLVQNFIKAAKGTIPKFRRVLIETTGLADPSGVISTLNNDDFVFSHYTFSGTITVLDGKNVREQLKKQYEAVKQIALADLILVSKTDLIDEEEVEAIEEIAHKINHSAKILPVLHGRVSPSVISEIGPYRDGDKRNQNMITSWLSFNDSSIASPLRPASVDNPLSAARPRIIAHSNIESFSIVREEPLPPIALLAAIALTAEQYGDSILRIKGILNLKDQDKPVIVHGVMGNLYPLSELEEWPEGKRETKLVFIVRATVLKQIKHIFTQALEHPDAAAMSYYESVVNAADSDVPQD